jgi:hypothetical protein
VQTKGNRINFASLFDEKERNNIKNKFIKTISSDSFTNEIKSEYEEYKNSNIQKIEEEVSNFYRSQKAPNDEKSQELSIKLMGSVKNYVSKHVNEYLQDGILTAEGDINSNPGEYINKEKKLLKQNFSSKEDNLPIEEIDKLMKLDQIFK